MFHYSENMPDNTNNSIRNRIILKCTDIFASRGFGKISMDEVAQSLGMSKKTIYKHFSSKEELVKSVILNFQDTTLSRIKSVLQDNTLDQHIRLVKVLEITGQQLSQIQKPILEDLKKYLPEFWKEIEERRRLILKQVYGKLLLDGKKSGIIRRDIDVDFFILMYISLVTSIVNPDVMSKISYNPAQVFHAIVKTLFTGILTDEARGKYENNYFS